MIVVGGGLRRRVRLPSVAAAAARAGLHVRSSKAATGSAAGASPAPSQARRRSSWSSADRGSRPAHHRIRHYVGAERIHAARRTRQCASAAGTTASVLRPMAPPAPAEMEEYEAGYEPACAADAARMPARQATRRTGSACRSRRLNERLSSCASTRTPARRAPRSSPGGAFPAMAIPTRISAAEFMSSCAHGDGSPEGMMSELLAHSLRVRAPGDLVRRMIDVIVRRHCASVSARRSRTCASFRSDVLVGCGDGERYRARAVMRCPAAQCAERRCASLRLPCPAQGARPSRWATAAAAFKLWIKAHGAQAGHAGDRWA